MTTVTDITFGAPPLNIAKAATGTLDNGLLTVSKNNNNLTVIDPTRFQNGKIKVQWSASNRPQPQKNGDLELHNDFVAVVLK